MRPEREGRYWCFDATPAIADRLSVGNRPPATISIDAAHRLTLAAERSAVRAREETSIRARHETERITYSEPPTPPSQRLGPLIEARRLGDVPDDRTGTDAGRVAGSTLPAIVDGITYVSGR